MVQKDLFGRNITPKEHDEQAMFCQWLEWNKIKYYSVPNGFPITAILSKIEYYSKKNMLAIWVVKEIKIMIFSIIKKMKKEGLKKGVPDICIPYHNKNYHGLYIELKRKSGGVLSSEQKEWKQHLEKSGYKVAVCKGFEVAKKEVADYFKIK